MKYANDQVKKYDWGKFPEFFGPWDWYRNSLILHELKRVNKSASILDFGCGSGILIKRMIEAGFRNITGMDASHESNSYLVKRYANDLDKFEIIQGDDQSLLSHKQRYDVIVSGETLEHIKQDERLIKSFYRLLNPGGFVIVSVPARMAYWNTTDVVAQHYRRYELKELDHKFKSAKFNVTKAKFYGYPLGVFWDKYLFRSMFLKKTQTKKSLVGYLASLLVSKRSFNSFFSNLFYFDQLFDQSERGRGLVLVAQR